MNYWLMKSEPDEFGIDDLARKSCEMWEGVRNYQARNFMQEMKKGDLIFFYHSSCKTVGIAGLMKVATEAYPDPAAVDPKHPYFDKKQPKENRWLAIDVQFVEKFPTVLTLAKIKMLAEQHAELQDLMLIKLNRLSVMPVEEREWICLMDAIKKNKAGQN